MLRLYREKGGSECAKREREGGEVRELIKERKREIVTRESESGRIFSSSREPSNNMWYGYPFSPLLWPRLLYCTVFQILLAKKHNLRDNRLKKLTVRTDCCELVCKFLVNTAISLGGPF